VSDERTSNGRFREKAGIRRDWIATKSDFCSPSRARTAFRELIDRVDARFIVLSYNTDGVIPFDVLYETLVRQGALRLFTRRYVKFRGGRQSRERTVHNHELAMFLDRSRPHANADERANSDILAAMRCAGLVGQCFHPGRLRGEFPACPGGIVIANEDRALSSGCRFVDRAAIIDAVLAKAEPERDDILARLDRSRCKDNAEEALVLIERLERGNNVESRLVLSVMRKLAHRKYAAIYRETASRLRGVLDGGRCSAKTTRALRTGLSALDDLVDRRTRG
jgi:adenine-specific DNA-methyltransferase